MSVSLFEYKTELSYYKFWRRKDRFILYEDVYDEWSLVGVEEGSFEYEINGEKGTAAFGDLVVCPPKVPFRRVVISPLSFHHAKVVLRRDGVALQEAREKRLSGKISVSDTERLKANYDILKVSGRAWKQAEQFAKCNHYVYDTWYLCFRELEAMAREEQETGVEDESMARAMQLIRQQAFRPLHLGELAVSLRLSPSRFTQRFKKTYGLAPSEYVTSLRLEKAKTLLLETDLLLDDVAESCGYQNGYYFNRVFTKEMGVTPGRFRKTNQM
ncbi:helix-turn-helix domain-containing protein [Paenibacillus antri]|uniref:Helix-turn-helix domain-containing protein n=1 Tax=Paenibacillus antri TaxID=2582848 RepID=A0A5R9GBL1_9BACL|nr:helix-turn-helix domain-containing protein [Paenibacillus antri]TLS51460.1 helix-turn-helix domain-containing protein [Paenibacillus antri]